MLKLKNEKVYLDSRHLTVANEFADKRCQNVGLYQMRGGFKRSDIIVGALGEMAVYKYLKLKGVKLDKPDFSIYENGCKTYVADMLTKGGAALHVKSQSLESAKLYGLSYLMQKKRSSVNGSSCS